MRIALLYHSLVSCRNNGHAHVLRGVASELLARGHELTILEPQDGWSRRHLVRDHGVAALQRFEAAFPHLRSRCYDPGLLDVSRLLRTHDLLLVHAWNDPGLVRRIGRAREHSTRARVLFHDTHHRSVTAPDEVAALELARYDGVLACGSAVAEQYLRQGWAAQAWVWHEAADTRLCGPRSGQPHEGDVVWIGDWGEGQRAEDLRRYLLEPVKALGLRACVYGVHDSEPARAALADAGITYRGWLADHDVPDVLARYTVTLHVPQRPYVESLEGVATVRPFQALACGKALLCSPWNDADGLFRAGRDLWIARDAAELTDLLAYLVGHRDRAHALGASGRRTVLARHTCAHRVDELLDIVADLGVDTAPSASASGRLAAPLPG